MILLYVLGAIEMTLCKEEEASEGQKINIITM
jgi:hypothetical protein